MGITTDSSGEMDWSYLLQDGECADSMALHTAKACGLPLPLIERAGQLAARFDAICRPTKDDILINKIVEDLDRLDSSDLNGQVSAELIEQEQSPASKASKVDHFRRCQVKRQQYE